MTRFVSVVGYRDAELPKTIGSLFNKADSPEELNFGIVSQDLSGRHPKLPFINPSNIKQLNIHAREARGAGFARKLAMEMYEGQDYFFQVDSHMRFASGWDTELIKMLKDAQGIAKNERVILSQFPAPYNIMTNGEDEFIKGDEDFWDDVSWTSVVNTWQGVWAGSREIMKNKKKPHKSHTILAGYMFAPGKIVEEIPYDERISFMGEELCFAIRAYTRGWDIYAPNKMLSWHFYKRSDRPKVWNDKRTGRVTWNDIELESQRVQMMVLTGKEEGVYGVGDRERYKQYQKMIGIDFGKFYSKEKLEIENLTTITQEIIFENFELKEQPKSGFCIQKKHSKCLFTTECSCRCHRSIGTKHRKE
jgi:hypothetical protein